MYYKDCGETRAAVKRVRRVDGKDVTTWSRDITDCCCIQAEAGTNGYQGGDWGHGSRVFLRLEDLAGTCFCNGYDDVELNDRVGEIVIALGGDSELGTIKEVLRWWLSILEAQTE